MINGKILKKETVMLNKSVISKVKGDLVLTPSELSFHIKKGLINKTEEMYLSIPISSIINVKAAKAFSYGVEHLKITYLVNGKEVKSTFEHQTMVGLAIGAFSRAEPLYFTDWANMIEALRMNEEKSNDNGLDELEKLAELKKKGIIYNSVFLFAGAI
jgi:hypothetical protein